MVARVLLGLGVFNTDLVTIYVLAVEVLSRRLGITRFGHLDKAKALGVASFFVDDQGAGLYFSVVFEYFPKLRLCGGAGQVAYQ